MDTLWSKVSSLFILAFSTTIVGILPLKIRKFPNKKSAESKKSDRIINAILAFSGGVLFSTIFIHLMPDVDAAFESAFPPSRFLSVTEVVGASTPPEENVSSIWTEKMPWGQLSICVGFFLIYALEEIVEYFVCRTCEEQHHHHNDAKYRNPNSGRINRSTVSDDSTSTVASVKCSSHKDEKSDVTPCLSPVHGTHGAHREPHQSKDCNQSRRTHSVSTDTSLFFDDVDLDEKTPFFKIGDKRNRYDGGNLSSTSKKEHLEEVSEIVTEDSCQVFVPNDDNKHDSLTEHSHHHHHHHEKSTNESVKLRSVRNTMRGLMLIVALSFHSVFEGMAIGLQSTTSGVWTSFAAVTLHKLVMAFCAGMELVMLETKRTIYFWSMITFALICPIGIAVGTIVTEAIDFSQSSESEEKSSLATASLQGLACGTLLYVTFFEVLTRTKGNEMASLINFVAVLFGFLIITGLHLLD